MNTTKKINLALCGNDHLSLCDTTLNSNGYPEHLCKAIYGFKSIEEAKDFAEEVGGSLGYIAKKDGWQVWYRKLDWDAQPYTLNCDDLGYNFEADNIEEFEQIARDEMMYVIVEEKSLDKMDNLMKDIMFVKEKIDSLLDGETVFFGKDGNFGASEIVDKNCMSYYYDTRTRAVAVIIDETENEVIEYND